MDKNIKKQPRLVSSISTSNAGGDFERRIQAFFVIQMIENGYVPTFPSCEITRILCQGKNKGFNTDDCVIFAKDKDDNERKLLVQCKLSISITESNIEFSKTINDAWKDFASNNQFDASTDKIALITGSLSKIDDKFLEILRHIHSEQTSENFWIKYNETAFNKDAKNKMGVVIKIITKANKDNRPSDESLFSFLKIFYILKSDLHEDVLHKGGINLSLLHSVLNNQLHAYKESPQNIWDGLIRFLNEYNRLAIPIEKSNLPNDLSKLFTKVESMNQQKELVQEIFKSDLKETSTLISSSYKRELALMSLVGGFDVKNEADILIAEKLFGTDFNAAQKNLQKLLVEGNITLVDGIWKVKSNRKEIVEQFASEIFDSDIDKFKDAFLLVLKENDSALYLSQDQRFMSGIYNENRIYSQTIRESIANGMALITNVEKKFSNCSFQKIVKDAISAVRELFVAPGECNIWENLNDVMTPLSEIDPKEFLAIVNKALNSENTPFTDFMNNYDQGVFSSIDHLSGLRWALSSLAWDKNYFGESAIILVKLSELEKINDNYNHQYAFTLLVETLLPWRPQTMAKPANRFAIVEHILNENPEIGWQLLTALLPNKTKSATVHPLPLWRDIVPEGWSGHKISGKEYWNQMEKYAELFVANAKNVSRISDVINNLSHLTKKSLDLFIKSLVQFELRDDISDKDRTTIWNNLADKIQYNERQIEVDAEYALPGVSLAKIIALNDKFAPKDIFIKYKRLFDADSFNLYDDSDKFNQIEDKLLSQRIAAIREIEDTFDIKMVVKLADEVKFPDQVGLALGKSGDSDSELLPRYIDDTETNKRFIQGYIDGRFYRTAPFNMDENIKWVESINFSNWNDKQIAIFFTNLPFIKPIWDMVQHHSQKVQDNYWKKVNDFRRLSDEEYSDYPFIKLLEANRPLAALEGFSWASRNYGDKKIPLSGIRETRIEMCRQILLNLIESKELNQANKLDSMFKYKLLTAIGVLQKSLPLTDSDLWRIEWHFISLFDGYDKNIPKSVIYSIENDPEIFHEMIRIIFKSKNELDIITKREVPSNVVNNIYSFTLTSTFRIMPGRNEDGKFVAENFEAWITKVRELCMESGHWESAQSIIGRYFVSAPADKSGRFIHNTVAKILNQGDNEEMRRGYEIGIQNDIGVQIVDSTGLSNRNRSATWEQRADEAEESGFIELASVLRNLARSFKMDSERDQIEGKKIENDIYR